MNNSIYILFFILSILIASYSQIILKKGAGEKNIYINKYTIVRIFLDDNINILHIDRI